MDAKDRNETVKVLFSKSNLHEYVYAEGAHGGVNPHGQIVCHFYSEHFPLPDSVDYIIGPGGKIDKNTQNKPTHQIDRVVQSTVTMSASTAYVVGKWLIDKAMEINPDFRNEIEKGKNHEES